MGAGWGYSLMNLVTVPRTAFPGFLVDLGEFQNISCLTYSQWITGAKVRKMGRASIVVLELKSGLNRFSPPFTWEQKTFP